MSNQLHIKALFESFARATRKDWEKAAASESKDQELAWKGPENLHFLPYYDREDISASSVHLSKSTNKGKDARYWVNQAPIVMRDVMSVNKKASNHLKNGANGLFIALTEHAPSFDQLLASEDLTFIRLSFYMPQVNDSLPALIQYVKHRNIQGNIFFKTFPDDPGSILSKCSEIKNLSSLGFYIEHDPNPVFEIQKALLEAVDLMDRLTDVGYPPEMVAKHIAFSLETGSNFFFAVAKFRALRLLWYKVMKAYQLDHYQPGSLHLHARSESFTQDAFQPNGNMLKGTTAALAAIAGGCDALSVFPEDDKNETMSRIARNVSTILREESHLHRVADPLAGSYFIEKLTNDFAAKAWENFQKELNVLK